ncbi:MAG TPA: hypothetical protein VF071_07505 [Candidatus Limnocylindria bacterium]
MLTDVIAYDGGYLGVGGTTAEESSSSAAIWLSADGTEWTVLPVTTAPADALWAGLAPAHVAAVADRLVVLAWGPSVPTVYVADGPEGPWAAMDLGEEACPTSLASSGSSVVVVGAIGACGYGGTTRPAVWVSQDGAIWELAELTSAGTGGGWVSGVIGVEDGYIGWGRWLEEPICDVGCEVDVGTDPYAGAPWVSADGTAWQRIDDPEPFLDTLVEQVVTIGDVYLALGWRGQGEGQVRAMWSSSDGASWEPLADEPPFLAAEPGTPAWSNQRIGGGSSGLVAWTTEATTSTLWYSFDGSAWETGATLDGLVSLVKVVDDRFFAFGTREEADPGITLPCTKDQVIAGRCRTLAVTWLGEP